jgi:hypothetical protein
MLIVALCFGFIGVLRDTSAATQTMTKTISVSADDARSPDGGGFTSTEAQALVGGGNGATPNVAGFRFTGVNIPKGSVITSVRLSLMKSKTEWNRIVLDCGFSLNEAGFSAGAAPAQRAMTSQKSHMDSNVMRRKGRRYDICRGDGLNASLQQLINSAGWASGDPAVLVAHGPASAQWQRSPFYMRDAGQSNAPQLIISYSPPNSVPPTNTPTNTPVNPTNTPVPPTNTPVPPTNTPVPPTNTPPTSPPGTGFGVVNACGEGTHNWHGPVVNGCNATHEHGDAPPSWVQSSPFPAHFNHPANTPSENVLKHTGFKGFLMSDDGATVYTIMHIDSNPNGHTSRFHSYQMWARDPSGNVSYWDGWLDFGQGNNTGPNLRRNGCDNTDVRPIMAVNDEPCNEVLFESWYSSAGGSGGWAPDFGFNLLAQYYTGGDPNNMATWGPTGSLNSVRRIELAWYDFRSSQRGSFWATQWGQIVSGPNDPVCGTSRTYGTKTYTTLCLQQYIAPTMTSVSFPGNSVQRTYSMTGVQLPN